MIKIVCDRCGKTITEDQEIGYIAWNFKESLGGDLVHENEFERNHYCPDCMDEIHAFISGGESSAKNACGGIGDSSTKNACGKTVEESAKAKPPKKPREKIDIGKIMALRDAGWSNPKIADEMGMTSGAVATAISVHRKRMKAQDNATRSGRA